MSRPRRARRNVSAKEVERHLESLGPRYHLGWDVVHPDHYDLGAIDVALDAIEDADGDVRASDDLLPHGLRWADAESIHKGILTKVPVQILTDKPAIAVYQVKEHPIRRHRSVRSIHYSDLDGRWYLESASEGWSEESFETLDEAWDAARDAAEISPSGMILWKTPEAADRHPRTIVSEKEKKRLLADAMRRRDLWRSYGEHMSRNRNHSPARRNGKEAVIRHAVNQGLFWDIGGEHDWDAIDVALDVLEAQAGQRGLEAARRTLPRAVKILCPELVKPKDERTRCDLVLSDRKPREEVELGPRRGRARSAPVKLRFNEPDGRWHAISADGIWAYEGWITLEQALEGVEDIEAIHAGPGDAKGEVTYRTGSVRANRSSGRRERVRGGLAKGMKPSDFDADALAMGTAVEMEHTSSRATAREIAMDHLVEDPDYYDKLAIMESGGCRPNRSRGPRVYEASKVAKEMRETFTNRPVEKRERFDFGWPPVMQAIGDSIGVAYGSDKWQDKDSKGRREVELYKHLAESRNRVLARPGVLHDHGKPSERWPVIGPKVTLASVPMPADFAVLGLFEGLDLELYTEGTDRAPAFGRADEGIIHVRVGHGYLGGSKILWSKLDPKAEDEPFLFVYTREAGVMFMVLGDELDIEKDGIVG